MVVAPLAIVSVPLDQVAVSAFMPARSMLAPFWKSVIEAWNLSF
jgi:hypothetical protein